MKHDDEEFLEYKSKSQRKRESDELEDLADFLIGMTAKQVKTLPVDQDMKDEIRNIQGISNLPARRRQTKYLAKMLRGMEPDESDALHAHIAKIRQIKTVEVENFHHIEVWRDRLCNEGEPAVNELARELTGVELGPLRRAVHRFHETSGKHEYRLVFMLLRKAMEERAAK